ncbi:class I SAM-dependent methyltransferase [Aspergillus homomorphus CBS 101889]|uniref:S-adenosyl-L-methionine-dependent methyltransferase n=1 Tax=Aspergillus homomorphus (strain CBS 101889) TaxID=1450537 RepID=A0A395IE15_ASPHC|nr:S-adenosyl-L-methionine-dependent methyltransferase [Aspergillus homomorphus CBS 101889]RAL16404.1 S-adenosyl-L-methionine-dependent methyltransferase [Aspergillus homomorphus CBS 101889]
MCVSYFQVTNKTYLSLSSDSETEDLDDRFLQLITVHGRDYQKYSIDHNICFQPVDDDEVERLELQHRVFNKVFNDRLIFPPLPDLESPRIPRRILDCGHGTASWAIEVAEQNPRCEIIGVDISPQMNPDNTPDNLWLQVDDLNRPFTFPSNHFDLVHSRMLATGIDRVRWLSYIQDIKRVLKPGGWVQMVEMYFNVQSDNGSLTEQHALRQWSTKFMRSLDDKKDLRVGTRLRDLLLAAGMDQVDARMIPLPLSGWANEPRVRGIGAANVESTKQLLSAVALYPMTKRLRMPYEEFQELISRAQQEAETLGLKAYFPLYVCIGRKPR